MPLLRGGCAGVQRRFEHAGHPSAGCAAGARGLPALQPVAAADADECSGEACEHIDVEPRAGRLVLFKSDELHEVMPAHALRYTVASLWILEAAAESSASELA